MTNDHQARLHVAEETMELTVIWDGKTLMRRPCNAINVATTYS